MWLPPTRPEDQTDAVPELKVPIQLLWRSQRRSSVNAPPLPPQSPVSPLPQSDTKTLRLEIDTIPGSPVCATPKTAKGKPGSKGLAMDRVRGLLRKQLKAPGSPGRASWLKLQANASVSKSGNGVTFTLGKQSTILNRRRRGSTSGGHTPNQSVPPTPKYRPASAKATISTASSSPKSKITCRTPSPQSSNHVQTPGGRLRSGWSRDTPEAGGSWGDDRSGTQGPAIPSFDSAGFVESITSPQSRASSNLHHTASRPRRQFEPPSASSLSLRKDILGRRKLNTDFDGMQSPTGLTAVNSGRSVQSPSSRSRSGKLDSPGSARHGSQRLVSMRGTAGGMLANVHANGNSPSLRYSTPRQTPALFDSPTARTPKWSGSSRVSSRTTPTPPALEPLPSPEMSPLSLLREASADSPAKGTALKPSNYRVTRRRNNNGNPHTGWSPQQSPQSDSNRELPKPIEWSPNERPKLDSAHGLWWSPNPSPLRSSREPEAAVRRSGGASRDGVSRRLVLDLNSR